MMNQKLVYKQLRNALHNRSIVTGRSGPGKISTPTHSHPSNVSSAASSTAMNTKSNISYSGNHSVATNPGAVGPKYNEFINPKALTVTKTKNPKEKLPLEVLAFGRSFSDHMMSVDWSESSGWSAPYITPYDDIRISPASTGLHYAIQCFEGMKAYKDAKGNIRLFRPDRNMTRFSNSMERLAMPALDKEGFLECTKQLLRLDDSWIPAKEGYSIYIRPTAIGTSPFLGVHASENVKVFSILSPVGPYYKGGFQPIKLYADTVNVRAWPGGVGNTKVGGNYAPTILPSKRAASLGCSQILWLYGENHEVTEVGAMNIFFVMKKPTGDVELVTAPLTRGDILPGVTRQSILELARELNEFEVNERFVTMGEIRTAAKEGRLLEAFGAGTAVVISPVRCIHYQDEDIVVPTGDKAGPIAQRMWNMLFDIQYGKVDHPWSVVV